MKSELDRQIQQAADVLRSFGAKEVYVFGSAAGDETDEQSDVDFAVAGLPVEVFLKAWARAVRSLPGREMDLVDLDRDEPFAQFLREHGELKRVG
jgi:predicted nucleotidyltransferase